MIRADHGCSRLFTLVGHYKSILSDTDRHSYLNNLSSVNPEFADGEKVELISCLALAVLRGET